jgi:hypothetical protein
MLRANMLCCVRTCVQAGDSAARLEREAEDLEVRYNRAQLGGH